MLRSKKLGIGLVLVGAGAIATLTGLPGEATPAVGVTSTVLARGAIDHAYSVPLKLGTDVAVVVNTFDVGGSSGWHSHPGGALVVVASGQITLYRSYSDHCTVTTYTQGQSFFERPTDVQNGVNDGTTQTVVYVAFPSVPTGGSTRIDMPDPGNCPS